MDYKAIEKRLLAAHTILQASSIDRATFNSLKTLFAGINPKVDTAFAAASKSFRHLDQLQKGDVIELTLEAWPDVTPEDKKRKKAFLLFFKFWNDLKAEVARVEKEFETSQKSGQGHAGAWGNIFSFAKGPLGIITFVATGVVLLKASEVTITVKNVGCNTITPPTRMAISIPGLKIPSVPLSSGDEAVAIMPPLSFTVDATDDAMARVSLSGMSYDFRIDPSASVTLDGQELIGKVTSIDLSSSKDHTLVISCR